VPRNKVKVGFQIVDCAEKEHYKRYISVVEAYSLMNGLESFGVG